MVSLLTIMPKNRGFVDSKKCLPGNVPVNFLRVFGATILRKAEAVLHGAQTGLLMVIAVRLAGWKPSSHKVSDQAFLRNAISTAHTPSAM
jgi:hypothetical protein